MIRILSIVLTTIFLISCCGQDASRDPRIDNNNRRNRPSNTDSIDVEKNIDKKAFLIKKRILSEFLSNGYLVNISGDEKNSAYFSLQAMAGMTCEDSQPIFDALEKSINDRKGLLVRFDPVPEDNQGGDESSISIERGFLYGISHRILYCGDSEKLKAKIVFKKHLSTLEKNEWEIYPNTNIYLSDHDRAIFNSFGLAIDGMSNQSILQYEIAALSQIEKTISIKEECLDSHDMMSVISAMGYLGVPSSTKDALCDRWANLYNPIVKNWCEIDQSQWLRNFKLNQYDWYPNTCIDGFKNMRSGEKSSAVDFLVVYSHARR